MSGAEAKGPFIVITCVLDQSARPAAITRCHGEAFDRAIKATQGKAIANLDIIELPIEHAAHSALRKHLGLPDDQVGVYDVFPLPASLPVPVRKAAAQFLAAESLWTLDAQGALGTDVLSVKLDLPGGWDKDPKAIHEKLVESGALDLGEDAVKTYLAVKEAWSA
jgi:hypothetical protein